MKRVTSWRAFGIAAALAAAMTGFGPASPADAVAATAYLGTNTSFFPGYDFCQYDSGEWPGTWAGANGDALCDANGGYLRSLALTTVGGNSAWSWAEMVQRLTVARRCTLQSGPLTGSIGASISYGGQIFRVVGMSDASATFAFGVGTTPVVFQSFTTTNNYSGSTSAGASMSGNIGDTLRPTLRLETNASTGGAYVANGIADFADINNGRYVRLNRLDVTWNDPSAPTTSHTVSSAQQSASGWHRSPATLSVTARDSQSCAKTTTATVSGSTSTYSVNSSESAVSIPVSGSGTIPVSYNATNYNNDVSGTTSTSVKVDGTAPATTATVDCDNSSGNCASFADVNFSCSDAHSGCAATYHRVDGGPWETGSAFLGIGDHTVEYYSVDQVGNKEATRSTFVRVVCPGPLAPVYDLTGVCVPL